MKKVTTGCHIHDFNNFGCLGCCCERWPVKHVGATRNILSPLCVLTQMFGNNQRYSIDNIDTMRHVQSPSLH